MKTRIPAIQLGFLIGFFVLAAGLIAYQVICVWPVQRCEAQGDWWDPRDGVCAVPIPISQFTGRRVGGKLVIEQKPAPTTVAKPKP